MLVIVRKITVASVRAMIRTTIGRAFTAFTALEALGQHRCAIFALRDNTPLALPAILPPLQPHNIPTTTPRTLRESPKHLLSIQCLVLASNLASPRTATLNRPSQIASKFNWTQKVSQDYLTDCYIDFEARNQLVRCGMLSAHSVSKQVIDRMFFTSSSPFAW